MGLLDNFLGSSADDPKTMAVMNMAAGLLGGGNFGQALGRGLGGYQETMASAKKNALFDEEMQWKRDERAAQRTEKTNRSMQIQRLQEAMKNDAVTGAELIRQGFPVDLIKDALSVKDMGRPEVARTADIDGPDGSKLVQGFDKFGNPVGTGVPGYVPPVQVNLGDRIGFTKPQSGQSFAVGMSPSERDASARGWASNSLAQQRLNFDKQGGVDGVMGAKLPPGYMWAAPGQAAPIPGTEAALKAQNALREKQSSIDNAQGALTLVDQALAHPGRTTATGLSSVLDPRNYVPGTQAKDFQAIKDQISGGAFLQAFESLKGGGAITEVEGKKAEQAIARMQTSQSDQAFEQALKDYRGVIETGMKRMSGAPQQTSPMSFDAGKESRYQMWKKSQGLQ